MSLNLKDGRSYAGYDTSFKTAFAKKGLNGIRASDLCDTDLVPYQLDHQVNWELVIQCRVLL